MSLEQARALIETASDLERHRLGAYVVLCVQTGIRTEEARALRWEHVDLDGRPDAEPPVPASIAVWRSVREHGDTKTRLSRRTLALPEHAAEVLREHRRRQNEARTEADELWQENDLLFSTSFGTKLDAGNVRRQFKLVAKAAELGTDWTPQELRHTFVSHAVRKRHARRGDRETYRSLEYTHYRGHLSPGTPTRPNTSPKPWTLCSASHLAPMSWRAHTGARGLAVESKNRAAGSHLGPCWFPRGGEPPAPGQPGAGSARSSA